MEYEMSLNSASVLFYITTKVLQWQSCILETAHLNKLLLGKRIREPWCTGVFLRVALNQGIDKNEN